MEVSQKSMEIFENYCKGHNITGKEKEEKFKLFMEILEKSMYEPLEAIGIVAAHSISEPATQMSISGNEKVIVKMNNKIKSVEIGELVDNMMELKGSFRINDSDVLPLQDLEVYCPTVNENEKIEWKRVAEFSRHRTDKKLIKLITASGREITATDNHSFVIRNDNKIVPIIGRELKKGDRIPVINKFFTDLPVKEIRINDSIEVNLKEDNAYTTNSSKRIKNTIELDWQTGWFIGAYLAEGCSNGSQIGISNIEESYISNARTFVDSLGLEYKDHFHQRGFALSRDFVVNSSVLSKFISTTCGVGSKNKHIPDFAYNADNEFVSGLLRGYFDGDGNFHEDRNMIRASSNSRELLDGIALLLSRFRIFSFKTKDKKGQYWLSIPYKYAPLFQVHISSGIERKLESLKNICENSKKFWDIKSQDYTDMISGFGDLFWNVAKKLEYPTRYVNNFTKRQKIGRTALLKYIRIFEQIAKEKSIDIKSELSIMRQMAYSDVVWDEIVDIKYVENSHYVYDFSVPGTETFTTSDGIITHNTMRTYTMATQRDRLSKVTQGLPRLIEIFDAKKSLEKQMEIYLIPEYNTKEKATSIADFIKAKKVKDVISSDSIDLIDLKIELELDREEEKDNIINLIKKANIDVSARGRKIFIKPKKSDVKTLRKLRSKLLDAHVDGIKGIEEVIVVKEGEEWMIQTAGTNLKKVLKVPGVDISRTKSNDSFQVQEVLGIEAARNIILEETKDTLDEQGLDIDIRHISLLADTMTVDGDVKAIGRYGVSGAKASVLARANFEETKKHLVNASFSGEIDNLSGVIENVLVVQVVPVGTGGVKLKVDVEKMIKSKG